MDKETINLMAFASYRELKRMKHLSRARSDFHADVIYEDDVLDACAFGGEYLLAYAAYGEYLASEGYLACHGYLAAHLALGECAGQRGGHGDACRGAVFGSSAFGDMDMYAVVVEDARVYVEIATM